MKKHEGDDSPLFACRYGPVRTQWHRQWSRGGGGPVAATGPAAAAAPAAIAEQGRLASLPSHLNLLVLSCMVESKLKAFKVD